MITAPTAAHDTNSTANSTATGTGSRRSDGAASVNAT
jgi:hypothetical protein